MIDLAVGLAVAAAGIAGYATTMMYLIRKGGE